MFATIEGALLVFRFTLRISKSIHAGYQAPGPHVSPILVDIVKAGLAARRLMDGSPTCWYVDELGPERILAFVVDQHHVGAVFVLKWITHIRDSAVASSIDQDKIKFKKPLGNRWLAELNPNSEVGLVLVLVLDESVFSVAKRARVSRNYIGPNSTLAIAKDFCVSSRSLEMFLILAWFGLLKIPSESI